MASEASLPWGGGQELQYRVHDLCMQDLGQAANGVNIVY